ncbi:MAG: HupE/UreJ family protein [Gemmatimonadaceae bacterium]|nr:HupE/UreJ family protein [Gemmatimonadaceae bacterium]
MVAPVSKHLRRWSLAAALLAAPATAAAHPLPETRAWIDVMPGGVHLLLHIPLNRLEFAVGRPLADHPTQLLARDGEMLTRYLLQHVGARTANVGWLVERPVLSVLGTDRRAELVADLTLRAPVGMDARRFTLLYDAVLHEVRTHRVEVMLRNDWAAGQAAQPPRLLGELRAPMHQLDIALPAPRVGGAIGSLVAAGTRHIADGSDHLLFLLLLILVAPLRVRAQRWREALPLREAWRGVVRVVTGFTVGHSVTLALGSLGVVHAPSTWVEVAVAATIVVAAVHAIRPLFARAELAMAVGFGLVHGLAFAASLDGAGLSAWQQAQALLAFNGGIELMQVAIVAVVMPALIVVLRRAPAAYAHLRVGLGAASGAVAVGWLADRSGLATVPALAVVDTLMPWIPVAVWSAALLSWAYASCNLRHAPRPHPAGS